MNKAEISEYLVNLHTLMQAQTSSVNSIPSAALAAEYEKYWGQLKSIIAKDNEDEPKDIRNASNLDEGRANPPRNQPRWSERDREHGRSEPDSSR